MFTNFVAVVTTVVMMWGHFGNPVVASDHYTMSDPFTGEVTAEWRTDYHFDGTVETIVIEP